MKQFHLYLLLLGLAFVMPIQLLGQDCTDCFKEGDCRMDLQKGFKIYSQSGGYSVTSRDTLELRVVFFGQKDYIFTFCTGKDMYPIHFQIYDTETGTLLYDNEDDRYIESLGIGIDVTKNLTFRIHAKAELGQSENRIDRSGCLGVLFQYKNYEK